MAASVPGAKAKQLSLFRKSLHDTTSFLTFADITLLRSSSSTSAFYTFASILLQPTDTTKMENVNEASMKSVEPQPTDTTKTDISNEASTKSVEPDVDVLLIFGPGSWRLLVSSKVLKKSSKVFAALLGTNFLEGQASNSMQPKEISLPDDDVIAMSDMCNLLHNNQIKDLVVRPGADRLLALAVVIDKYDCVDALQLQIQGIVLGYPITRRDLKFKYCARNSLASYLLKHSRAFKILCARAIGLSTQPLTTFAEAGWATMFPLNLIYALEQNKSAMQQRIVFELPYTGVKLCCRNRGANHTNILKTKFGIDFWPPKFSPYGSHSLSSAIEILQNMDNVQVATACDQMHGTLEVKPQIFKHFADDLIQDCMKVCLDCVMAGRMDFKYKCEDKLHQADYKVMLGM